MLQDGPRPRSRYEGIFLAQRSWRALVKLPFLRQVVNTPHDPLRAAITLAHRRCIITRSQPRPVQQSCWCRKGLRLCISAPAPPLRKWTGTAALVPASAPGLLPVTCCLGRLQWWSLLVAALPRVFAILDLISSFAASRVSPLPSHVGAGLRCSCQTVCVVITGLAH